MMFNDRLKWAVSGGVAIAIFVLLMSGSAVAENQAGKQPGPPPSPVRIAKVEKKMVSDQISLVGTAEPIARSTVAAELSGIVEYYPVREGDFVNKGDLLARLRCTDLEIRLKGAIADRERIRANLDNAEKELSRAGRLKAADSIAEKKYDEALYAHRALSQEFVRSQVEIERLEYEINQKKVLAPFSGFVSKEHTQVGEWITPGGAVVSLLDLGQIRITVDVPERYSVMLSPQDEVSVVVKSVSGDPRTGRIYAVLHQGDPNSRTFPVRINLPNPGFKIKSGMEALVTFSLSVKKNVLVVPKDAVVPSGNDRLVFLIVDGKAAPVAVNILGYYDGWAAVEGNLKPGDSVVIRGNERLRPGQAVMVTE